MKRRTFVLLTGLLVVVAALCLSAGVHAQGDATPSASPPVTVTTEPASPSPSGVTGQTQNGQQPQGGQVQQPAPAPRPTRSQARSERLREFVGSEGAQGPAPIPGSQAPVDQPSLEGPQNGAVPKPLSPRRSFTGGPVSFNFDDADVYSVIQTVLGDLLRVNYIIDPKVKGRVTFRSVAPVPRENVLPIMEVILRLNGIGIVEEAGLFRVIQITDIAKEPAPIQYGRDPAKVAVEGKSLLQVVPILNIQSTEIVKLISSFASTNAVLIDVPRGNHVIIVDTDANVKRLLELVQIFDGEQFKKRKGEVYVYPVQNSKAKDVATLLQQIFMSGSSASSSPSPLPSRLSGPTTVPTGGTNPAAPSPTAPTIVTSAGASSLVSDITRILSDETTNSIVVVGTPEDYSVIKEAIEKIDTIPRQVVIEGVIAEVTLTDSLSLGLAYSLKATMNSIGLKGQVGLNPSELVTTTTTTSGTSTTSTTTPVPFTGSGLAFLGVDSAGTVRALLNALASQSKGKLLATPHILVADNRQARIQVGQQVPIITSQTDYAVTAGATTQTVQYKDIGIILKVKPQVNEGGLVALEIDQEVSTYTKDTLYAGTTQIILNKTEAATNVVVSDGQTIVIGGLIREDSNKNDSGIPFLYKIPILGYLFGEKSRDTNRRELIILLTPHVIKTQDQARDVTQKYVDKFSSMGTVKKEELGGVINDKSKAKENGAK